MSAMSPAHTSVIATASAWAQRAGHLLIDSLYPRICRHCETPLETTAPRQGPSAWLCAPCQELLHRIEPPFCQVCGEAFEGAMAAAFTCQNCANRRIAFDFAVAGVRASGPIRELIHHFKYSRDITLTAALADFAALALADPRLREEDLRSWILVPVPLHTVRQLRRGFNQSWEICRQLSRQTGIPALQALRRQRRTETQVKKTRSARLENLRRAFGLRRRLPWQKPLDLKGAKILLVDDVLTTGATAHECAKVLKREGGVEKVVVITAARG